MKFIFYLSMFLMFFSTQVDCQKLTVKKGFLSYQYFEDETQLSKKELHDLLYAYPESERLMNKSKRNLLLGLAALGADIIIFERIKNEPYEVGDKRIILSVLSGAFIIRFFLVSRITKNRAIKKYNEQFDLGHLGFSATKNGYGLVLNF